MQARQGIQNVMHALCRGIPVRLHVGPLYPLGHWQVSLATQTPLSHAGSHTTEARRMRTHTQNIIYRHAKRTCFLKHTKTQIHTLTCN